MIKLFDDRERTDAGPAHYTEPHIEYLNRSARPQFQSIRDQLQTWLKRVPQQHRGSLIRRMQSRDDHHFESAFFELYLHALLVGLNYSVRFHPTAGRGKRPDFLLRSRSGGALLLEAGTVDELSATDRGARRRLVAIYDALNKIQCADYFFHVEHDGEPNSPIPLRTLRRHVEQFVADASYDHVVQIFSQKRLNDLPSTSFKHDGCSINVSLWPVSAENRGGLDHRPVGMLGPAGARWVDDRTPIRDKIRSKANTYGKVRRPLVVAINAAGRHIDHRDMMDALFGKESYRVTFEPKGTIDEVDRTRILDGAWISQKGPQNRRVSAVLVVSSLLPWTVCTHPPVVYHNPWARYPIQSELRNLDSYIPADGHMELHLGKPVNEILDLPPHWPRQLGETD